MEYKGKHYHVNYLRQNGMKSTNESVSEEVYNSLEKGDKVLV